MIYLEILQQISDKEIKLISKKIFQNIRISSQEALILFEKAELSLLSVLAEYVRKRINGNNVFYVRNYHIEPTNKCIHKCKFCSYSERISGYGWELSDTEIIEKVSLLDNNITELHIVGGVHPIKGIKYYIPILKKIKEIKPNIHIKAFTAVEIEGMANIDNISTEKALILLKEAGLNSIPGGGAEIFNKTLRAEICPTKTTTDNWLNIHRTAHKLGIPSNATMLYGFFETYQHRVEHLEYLRNLQDETNGFNAFIPLKFRNKNNEYSHISEVSITEDLKNFAISRIFLDNIPHLKSYWPMMGIDIARISLHFGVDDLDGTINNSTKIYSMAGSVNEPSLSANEINKIIIEERFVPIERDAVYNCISNL